jgi:hypothetical protein
VKNELVAYIASPVSLIAKLSVNMHRSILILENESQLIAPPS